jgi:hypothetical protein
MPLIRRRRPGRGAAPDNHVDIDNSNVDPRTGSQPSAMQSFWIEAGGFVTCTIVRRSDQAEFAGGTGSP